MTLPLRFPLLLFAYLIASAFAAETPAPTWPLWDGHETIEQYAKRVNLPATKTLDLGVGRTNSSPYSNGVKLELVLIPAGKFVMGTPEPEKPKHTTGIGQAALSAGSLAVLAMIFAVAPRAIRKRQRPEFSLRGVLGFVFCLSVALYGGIDWWWTAPAWREYEAALARYRSSFEWEKPAHEVTITKPLYVGKCEVTQEQYQQVMGSNPSHFKGLNLPVEQVTWDDAQEFCRKAVEKIGQIVRVPTEAEWEYACRAGIPTYCTGDAQADLGQAAWYVANSKKTTHPVGHKTANAWGFYDMYGNVWEWCVDRYGGYERGRAVDPQGPTEGPSLVIRGGAWIFDFGLCRSASRGCCARRDYGDSCSGFRVVVEVAKTP